jgi:hypothetical protein
MLFNQTLTVKEAHLVIDSILELIKDLPEDMKIRMWFEETAFKHTIKLKLVGTLENEDDS